ncbi:hypothetical protein ON010_g18691 [Phytophthora cinnamomi]|nr:hypothetical protein ON010_g18691 [Phytophthora cinnamomi]
MKQSSMSMETTSLLCFLKRGYCTAEEQRAVVADSLQHLGRERLDLAAELTRHDRLKAPRDPLGVASVHVAAEQADEVRRRGAASLENGEELVRIQQQQVQLHVTPSEQAVVVAPCSPGRRTARAPTSSGPVSGRPLRSAAACPSRPPWTLASKASQAASELQRALEISVAAALCVSTRVESTLQRPPPAATGSSAAVRVRLRDSGVSHRSAGQRDKSARHKILLQKRAFRWGSQV